MHLEASFITVVCMILELGPLCKPVDESNSEEREYPLEGDGAVVVGHGP